MKQPQQTSAAGNELIRLTKPLLIWYNAHRRELPWRRQADLPLSAIAYRVWVSEIMLQQTRIETVLPYYDRFMEALPTVTALAEVGEDRLLKLWEGLGYYSRARNLQRAARVIVRDYGGQLPASFEELRALPGIGDYTAGAIASIAFRLPVPAVDGNVLRVMARLTNDEGDITKAPVKKSLGEAVITMLPEDAPGDFNEALMELGETVCLPNTVPLCDECPLAEGCAGRRAGDPVRLPVRAAKKARRSQQRTVFVILSEGRVLLHRREPRGLLAGMWELPGCEGWLEKHQAEKACSLWGAPGILSIERLPEAHHIFSHVEWHMRGYLLVVPPFDAPPNFIWMDARTLREETALPSAFRAYSSALPRLLSTIPNAR